MVKPNGEALTTANIGMVLATRDLMQDLRSADPFRQGGAKPFSRADRSRLLDALDRAIRRAGGGSADKLLRNGAITFDRDEGVYALCTTSR